VVEDIERPGVRLADVGGMQQVKERLELSFLGPMRNPQLAEAFGKSLSGGLLLYGPPGCGKTVLWKVSWRLRMLFVLATVACIATSAPVPDEPTWAARAAAAVALLVIGLLAWWTVRSLPAQTRPAVRAALRTEGPLRVTYLAIAACALLFLLVAVTGLGLFAALVWLVLIALGVLAVVAGLVGRFRRA